MSKRRKKLPEAILYHHCAEIKYVDEQSRFPTDETVIHWQRPGAGQGVDGERPRIVQTVIPNTLLHLIKLSVLTKKEAYERYAEKEEVANG